MKGKKNVMSIKKKISIGDSVILANGAEGVVEDYDGNALIVRTEQGTVERLDIPEDSKECCCEECKPEKLAEELIRKIKVASINMKTLHRNIKGGNWFRTHDLLREYYYALDHFEDDVIEVLMSIGMCDKSIAGSTDIIEARPYEAKEALCIAKKAINEINCCLVTLREEVCLPASVSTVFDELEHWCAIEAEYKLKNFLACDECC